MPFLIAGSASLSVWSLSEVDRALADWQVHTDRAPPVAKPSSESAGVGPSALSGHAAFVIEIYPDEYMRYMPDLDTPGEWIVVGSVAGTAYYAGDFVGRDYDRLYVIDYSGQELHRLDAGTGADTAIGGCTPVAGQVWTGATGTADGMLYASSTNETVSYLYTVNTATGAATEVGPISNGPGIIDIAINADGEMYGVDIVGDNLVRIDTSTGAGTVVGSIGFDANYAQGMDFDPVSGELFLAAYNVTSSQGELRLANTSTGSSTLVGAFPDGDQVGVLALTPPPAQVLQNPGFESGWPYWHTAEGPILSGQSHSGSWSVLMTGESCWVWQEVTIPADALEVALGYWITGISSDPDWDNDLLCGGIWDPTWQTQYVDMCFGLTYFLDHPNVWRYRTHRLEASELASVAGRRVNVAFQLSQNWSPGYHQTSTAYVDDTVLYVTRPVYDYAVYLPLAEK
jgi:hypothetical protein